MRKTSTSVNRKPKAKKKSGMGILNSAINRLPFEMHIPGYQFCGPGTKLNKRLTAGQTGINGLDKACKMHDIAYSSSSNVKERNIADNVLAKQAMARVKSRDAKIGEKIAALTVAGLTKIKSTLGAGLRKNKKTKSKHVKPKQKKGIKRKQVKTRQKITNKKKKKGQIFRNTINSVKKALNNVHPKTMSDAVHVAMKAAKSFVGNHSPSEPANHRIIPVPKIGGVLPLIPIFAGLSALGALTGGSAAVANAVITANNAKKRLKESERHNEMMEAIALGKNRRGEGVYLKPYKNGLGLYTHKKIVPKNS